MENQVRDALLAIEGVQTIDTFSVLTLHKAFIITCELSIMGNRVQLDIARDCLMALYELFPRGQWVSPAFTLKNNIGRWNYAYNQNRKRWQIINLTDNETSYTEDDL